MVILILTIPVTITLVILFLILFVLASKKEQFDDLETPKLAPLSDDDESIYDNSNPVVFEENI